MPWDTDEFGERVRRKTTTLADLQSLDEGTQLLQDALKEFDHAKQELFALLNCYDFPTYKKAAGLTLMSALLLQISGADEAQFLSLAHACWVEAQDQMESGKIEISAK